MIMYSYVAIVELLMVLLPGIQMIQPESILVLVLKQEGRQHFGNKEAGWTLAMRYMDKELIKFHSTCWCLQL